MHRSSEKYPRKQTMRTSWPKYLSLYSLLVSLVIGDDLRFASYYGDHMVLQKAPEKAVLWGYGARNAAVVVSLSQFSKRWTYDTVVSNGTWRVTLDPMQAGGPYNISAVRKGPSRAEVTLTDVLFGDVWLCGGQSNMAFTLSQVFNSSAELALAPHFPDVRIFQASLEMGDMELRDLPRVEVPWSRPTAELLGDGDFTHFSAVCWLFGRYLHQSRGYPIGLVESCWGGTPVEAWSSQRPLLRCGVPQTTGPSGAAMSKHVRSVKVGAGSAGLKGGPMQNSVLWNAMIHPLLNMTITGAIWYQGESNHNHNRDKYNCTFPSMVEDWRMAFHQGSGGQTAPDFPFGFVQLSTSQQGRVPNGFPEIRWHQTADIGFVPNHLMKKTFMAVAMDVPDSASQWGSIHPRYKQEVAYRLSLGARAIAYEERGVVHQGPFPAFLLINHTHLLIVYNLQVAATPSKDLFEICCSDGKESCDFLDGGWMSVPMMPSGRAAVALSLDGCPSDHVASVRYAWLDWPCEYLACPVYSSAHLLPAPPFLRHRQEW